MTEKRFTVAVYDENAINGFTVLDLEKPNSSKRLKYENVYIGSKVGCEIVCNFGNSLADENEQLKSTIKEVIELLSEEVDLFIDKATEYDINAYIKLKELDDKDAFYMAIATKKAIKMLKELK